MNKSIFIAGGGTGGHLFPALSIGNELIKNNINIYYIGSKYGIEKDFFDKNKLNYYLLNIRGIQRNFSLKSIINNIMFPIYFIQSYSKSIKLIRRHKPIAIIGTGGYCSGVPLIAGIRLKIPTFIQDQNSIPGLITKILQKRVNKIFLGYNIKEKFKINNSIYTGNPIRKELLKKDKLESKKILGFDKNKKLIFILGGSQGSSPINKHILKNIDFYNNEGYEILWQSGKNDFELLKSKISHSSVMIKQFINDMSLAYSAADIIISRAGALAISEMSYMGKAMILIPFPQAAENHQHLNAKIIADNNACILIEQKQLQTHILEESIKMILNSEKKIKKLEYNSKMIAIPNTSKKIVTEIIKSIEC